MTIAHDPDVLALLDEVVATVDRSLPRVLALRGQVTIKEDGSPVSQADLFIEDEVYRLVDKALGRVSFISEETPRSLDEPSAIQVILDPIDGTENFVSGLSEWGVSLGIWSAGVHVASLLHLPAMGLSLRTGQQIAYSRSRIVGLSSSYSEEIGELMRSHRECRVIGCAVYNLFNVCRGSFSRFVNPKGAYVWDLLPGLNLALEHNCRVLVEGSNYHGGLLPSDRRYRVDVQHRYDLRPR